MAGKRLLDVAALFNASRGVAQKHVALRSRQVEVWSETSSIAKAVKSQSDRVTKTAKAVSFIASRLNETGPSWTSEASQKAGQRPVPNHQSTETAAGRSGPKGGLKKDHCYKASESHVSPDQVPTRDLKICQEEADRLPLPDGSIPPISSRINITQQDHCLENERVSSQLKIPVRGDNNEEALLRPAFTGKSTIHNPPVGAKFLSSNRARILQRQSEEQIPSHPADAGEKHSDNRLARGRDEDIFYTPPKHASPVLSSIPRVKVPKRTGNTQGNDEHLQYNGINSDSYSAAITGQKPIPTAQAGPEQEWIPDGANTDLFYSPRVAKLLRGRTQTSRKGDLKVTAAEGLNSGYSTKISGVKPEPETSATLVSFSRESIIDRREMVGERLNKGIASDAPKVQEIVPSVSLSSTSYEMRQSKVPSSRIGRLWNYGGLAAGMFGGAVTESFRRATGSGGEGSYLLSAGNMNRLVAKLSKMRGAALKLGQMMSFQDSKMLPAPIQQVLLRVQDSADYMPPSQRNKVLAMNLGKDWEELFSDFDEKPIAAASIGQVHSAVLRSNGDRVAVKVQYPGVAVSIDSDLSNLSVLLTASRLLPRGLYLDKTIANARTELAWECDYIREAQCAQRFQDLLSDERDVFVVPRVYLKASGKQVLTMEYMDGTGVTKLPNLSQEQKDWIGTQILRLCLREITEFKFMQTDPNWTNFLYNAKKNKLELLDFGASREYPEEFISWYTRLLLAASESDKATVRSLSIELGYLTGHESKTMLNAHTASVLTLAEPFLATSPEIYDFRDQTITERVKALIPLMVRERLAPPPEETYSLHRKLSGAFLLCARLGSRVPCRQLFEDSMRKAGLV